MKPLISVIVPIYKVEKYLAICVDSLLRQSYGNLEVILVDDGSPDECPAICDKYQNKDNRIKVIHKKNGGLSDARNVGLDIAQGEYVAFVDSDDFVDEDYIYKLYNALQQNRTSIAVCGIQIIDESNKVTDQICVTQDKKQELYTGKEIIKKELQGEWVLVTAWGALYERADSIMGVTYKKQDCMDYFEMWHERIDYFQAKEDRELLAPVIQSCLAWNVLYLAMNGEAMEEPEKRLLKKDIRKYFWKIFAKPYLYNWKESVKLAVKCVMVLMNDKSLGKRYV